MSYTRIACERCGLALAWCECAPSPAPTPPDLPEGAVLLCEIVERDRANAKRADAMERARQRVDDALKSTAASCAGGAAASSGYSVVPVRHLYETGVVCAPHCKPAGDHGSYEPLYTPAALAEIRRQTIEECARVCDDYPKRDPAGDGSGYWAADECSAAIRALAARSARR